MAISDDQMYRALAVAFSTHPSANLLQVAKAAGVSKTTLYRFASTRERLLDLLRQEGVRRSQLMYDSANLESAPPRQAVSQLAKNLLTEREFCAFMFTDYELVQKANFATEDSWTAQCVAFESRLDALFLRGQKEGVFRLEMPASWMTDLFYSILYAVVDAERRGRLAPADMHKFFQASFFDGACISSSA